MRFIDQHSEKISLECHIVVFFFKIYSINVNFQFTKRHIKNLFQYPSSTFKTDDMKTHLYK